MSWPPGPNGPPTGPPTGPPGNQSWPGGPPTGPDNNGPATTNKTLNSELQRKYFTLTAQDAQTAGPYDIVIIGTGVGGGVLAGDLFDTNSKLGDGAKSILVIEKGNLLFHSFCLNSARPGGAGKDRGHQNGLFFSSFKSEYAVEGAVKNWKGGPMYCLGGRSSTWGLFIPRMHDSTLRSDFPESVRNDLTTQFYEKAEQAMNLALPPTKTIHRQVMERLNMDAEARNTRVQWQWGRTASENRFSASSKGAFSCIDKLLEIAMSKPEGQAEHKNFKILLGTEVREIVWKEAERTDARGNPGRASVPDKVKVRTASGEEVEIPVAENGRVIVSAGSVGSPALLMRSNAKFPTPARVGNLRDHEILYKVLPFRYRDPSLRSEVGPMKLQTYVSLGDNNLALVNLCLDASGFVPRTKFLDDDIPKFAMTFTTKRPLKGRGRVRLVSNEPVLEITEADIEDFQTNSYKLELDRMRNVTEAAIKTIETVLKVEFLEERPDEAADDQIETDPVDVWDPEAEELEDAYFRRVPMGAVAHEMGTLPMTVKSNRPGAVDENLQLRGHRDVYVCDLSVFPSLSDTNPSLTLAALAIRLSRALLPRIDPKPPSENELRIVNHSGTAIQVWVTNQNDAGAQPEQNVRLGPGELQSWTRTKDLPEAVFIFRRNTGVLNEEIFFPTPELVVGFPGRLLPIL